MKLPLCMGSKEGLDPLVVCVRSLSLQILQEAVSTTRTHDLLVTRRQFYHCAKAPLHLATNHLQYLFYNDHPISTC
jgi:hypothetical protein